jgi:hypothetical protein
MTKDKMAEEPESVLSNRDRLLQHLPPDSLAARLVKAAPDPADGLNKALAERLDQVRQDLGRA